VSDAEKLKPQEYDSRLARIIQELREKGIDGRSAATTAALADASSAGSSRRRCRRTCSADWDWLDALEVLLFPGDVEHSLQCRQREKTTPGVR